MAAGIDEEACFHCFRHRFITKMLVRLIEDHHFTTEDALRRALLSTETIKRKLMEWTGHRNIKSLDRYVHLAFEEVTNYKATITTVAAKMEIESVAARLEDLGREIKNASPSVAIEQLHELLQDVLHKLQDIGNAK